MNLLAEVMPFLAAAGLALFVGALLTEAMVLVPMWRTFQPQEFFTLHAAHAHRLYTFFCAANRERNASCGCCCHYIRRHGSSAQFCVGCRRRPRIGHSFNVCSVLSARQRQLCRSKHHARSASCRVGALGILALVPHNGRPRSACFGVACVAWHGKWPVNEPAKSR